MIIVPRSGWNARPPKRTPFKIPIPTPRLWLHHSAGGGSDETRVRAIQDFHMDVRGWNDIAYSFLIDNDPPDVDIFEGRGAGIAGGHTAGDNTQSHGICVIGDFSTVPPADDTLRQIAEVVAYGHKQEWWPLAFTGGHRDAPGANTSCPGTALHRLIPEINAEAKRIHDGDDMALTPGAENAAEDWNAAFGKLSRADQQALMRKIVAIGKAYPETPVEPLPGPVDGLKRGDQVTLT